MANMSYCRFQNALEDLEDCQEHMDEALNSLDEAEAREALIQKCKAIAMEFGE